MYNAFVTCVKRWNWFVLNFEIIENHISNKHYINKTFCTLYYYDASKTLFCFIFVTNVFV